MFGSLQIVVICLLQRDRNQGIRSSGSILIYWLLMTLYGALKFRTYLLIELFGTVLVTPVVALYLPHRKSDLFCLELSRSAEFISVCDGDSQFGGVSIAFDSQLYT